MQTCVHKKDRSLAERSRAEALMTRNLGPYSAPKNFRMRSSPRSSSAFDVA